MLLCFHSHSTNVLFTHGYTDLICRGRNTRMTLVFDHVPDVVLTGWSSMCVILRREITLR